MQRIKCDFLNGISKDELKRIDNDLKMHKYSNLDINLRHPCRYDLVIPHITHVVLYNAKTQE